MRLTYRILWLDDQIEDYIEMGIKSDFESYLDNLGFTPTIDTFEKGNLALEAARCNTYDLILSDYQIDAQGETGDAIIKGIRDGGIFTEVLFYSAKPDFDNIARGLYRDRVSFLSLVGDSGMREFKSKVVHLIGLTIAKVQELNNIRGLVMAETSELDNSIEDILHAVLSEENDDSNNLRAYIIQCIQDSVNSNQKIASKLLEIDNNNIIRSRLFDADKKSRSINHLLRIKKLDQTEKFANFYERYKKDVLDIRNDLAHAKSDIIDGEECLIISRKGTEHPLRFNHENCIQTRKNLRDYSSLLRELKGIFITS